MKKTSGTKLQLKKDVVAQLSKQQMDRSFGGSYTGKVGCIVEMTLSEERACLSKNICLYLPDLTIVTNK